MRALLCILLLCVPVNAQADLLDLLPLKAIERKMLYPLSTVEVDPADVGLPNTKVHRLKRDGATFLVWFVPAKRRSNVNILYFHGNAGNLATRASRFQTLQREGFNVIAMSYRGSSGSTGKPSEPAITQDAKHLYQSLVDVAPNAKQSNIILYGESLGSAVAIALLAQLSQDQRPAGMILEAPFTSTPDMARAMAEIPDNLIARISDRWDSRGRANAITIPTLIIHGTSDEVTPIQMGRTLFKVIPIQDKDFIAVRGASHSGTWRSDTLPKLWRFIRAYGQN